MAGNRSVLLTQLMEEQNKHIHMLTQAANGCRKHATMLLETGDIQGAVRVMTDALTASAELAQQKLKLFQARTKSKPDMVAICQ